jgi:hypothetical protein
MRRCRGVWRNFRKETFMNQTHESHSIVDRIGNALKAGAVVAAVALVALAAHYGDVVPQESKPISTANATAGTAAPGAHYLPSQFNQNAKALGAEAAPTF